MLKQAQREHAVEVMNLLKVAEYYLNGASGYLVTTGDQDLGVSFNASLRTGTVLLLSALDREELHATVGKSVLLGLADSPAFIFITGNKNRLLLS